MMQVNVENITLVPAESRKRGWGRDEESPIHYTFWVRFMVFGSEHWVSTGGWRYWPHSRKIGTPSINKGSGKFLNLLKIPASTWNLIRDKVERDLGLIPELLEPVDTAPTSAE